MHAPKVDFLQPSGGVNGKSNGQPEPPSRKRVGFFVLVFFFLAVAGLFALNKKPAEETSSQKKFSLLGSMRSLITSGDRDLKSEDDGRVNVLLLGIGGEGHEGAKLTDTIILASIEPESKKVGLLSIPRDLFVPIPGYGYRRINNAYPFAEDTSSGSGGNLIRQVVSDVMDLDVQYFVRVDFQGFEQLINDLGGITVNVPRAFSDPLYPTYDFKTQVISFEAGSQIMDGETALKYVRSRHGSNGEGSDFSRSKRQQQIILAIRDKVLSRGVLASPTKLLKSWQTLKEHVDTNMEPWELLRLATIVRETDPEKVVRKSLEPEPLGPLTSRLIDDAFVLLPSSGSWDDVRDIAKNILNSPIEVKKKKMPAVEIQNGTVIPGYAASISELLRRQGFQIIKIGNARARDYEKSVIYDVAGGEQKEALEKLKNLLNANVSLTLSGFFNGSGGHSLDIKESPIKPASADVDFLIILGTKSLAVIE